MKTIRETGTMIRTIRETGTMIKKRTGIIVRTGKIITTATGKTVFSLMLFKRIRSRELLILPLWINYKTYLSRIYYAVEEIKKTVLFFA